MNTSELMSEVYGRLFAKFTSNVIETINYIFNFKKGKIMQKEKKNRVKEFVQKHETKIDFVKGLALLGTAFVLGTKFNEAKYSLKLNLCFCANPELKAMMLDTCERVNEIIK